MEIRIGTAGWSLHTRYLPAIPAGGSHLERYARVFDCAEINSSFYRPHQRATYERWAASTPPSFRFAVKVPTAATHEARLVDTDAILDRFIDEAGGLGERLGVLLVQLPPNLAFDEAVAARFFAALRERHRGGSACEPRHPSWFEPAAEELLVAHRVARTAADPPKGSPAAAAPGGWPGLAYYRLHGAPRIYFSDYPTAALKEWAARLKASAKKAADTWCIFDNTAGSEAIGDALETQALVRR